MRRTRGKTNSATLALRINLHASLFYKMAARYIFPIFIPTRVSVHVIPNPHSSSPLLWRIVWHRNYPSAGRMLFTVLSLSRSTRSRRKGLELIFMMEPRILESCQSPGSCSLVPLHFLHWWVTMETGTKVIFVQKNGIAIYIHTHSGSLFIKLGNSDICKREA